MREDEVGSSIEEVRCRVQVSSLEDGNDVLQVEAFGNDDFLADELQARQQEAIGCTQQGNGVVQVLVRRNSVGVQVFQDVEEGWGVNV